MSSANLRGLFFFLAIFPGLAKLSVAVEPAIHEFERQSLTTTYYSEGVSTGDINGDGHVDVVYGPYWFAGPSFERKYEIYQPVPQPTERYADHFFCWTHDFNRDNRLDVLVVGFPGTPAYVYENPGDEGFNAHWPKHEVFDWVSNESPQWIDLVGDERPELVCSRDGYLGYVTPNWDRPFEGWKFQRISEQVAAKRFGHGLGVGDVNGDGQEDVLVQNGWYEQPRAHKGLWRFHAFDFTKPGGADIWAYDVDGDGDNDVITSIEAHGYGLAWFEQIRRNGRQTFVRHTIMGRTAAENKYGVIFTEPHSVVLADVDGDGLKDICTGKTYWSHHKQAPMWDAGAVVYWFKLSRTSEGIDWIPHKVDGAAGVGRQLVVADVNNDTRPDFVTGGMKGCHVIRHSKQVVDQQRWLESQPQVLRQMQAGLPPAEAARQMTVPPGFQVQLAAGEPLVHQPVAFTMDHRGRLWVAEAYTYPLRAPEGQGRDKIVILEDTNQDGTLDSRKEFMDGLNLVSGLEVGFGGVWVGAAPYFMFIPDANGDDIPDAEPKILLDGFGYQDTHETLNSFIWGPDGWLYGCHGVFTHSKVGEPGATDAERVPVNAAVWRYHPTRHVFDVFARGTSNPWGLDFNEHGQAFITACVIPHLWHIVQGARYQRQGGQHFNPYLYDDIKTIADHSHYTGNIRDSAWWGHEPELSDSVSLAGGGHAHCGAMIYLGDNWPSQYRDSIYFNNIHGNRVNNDILERHGSGYVGHHGKDFLMANDKWYRGINLKYGPDGTVHLIDWYDKNACHRVNPEIWDRSNGRIYRVSFGDVSPKRIDLSSRSDLELVDLQAHPNDWYVRTARRLLQERAADGHSMDQVHPRLIQNLQTSSDTPRRLRSLWALHVTGGAGPKLLKQLMKDRDEHVRAWAIQLAFPEVLPGESPPSRSKSEFATLLALAAHDDSPLVRLYVASALQRMPLRQRWEIADALLQHADDADDHNLPLMIWYGVEPLVTSNASKALELATRAKIPRVARFIARRLAAEENLLGELVATIASAESDRQHVILDEMLMAFEGRVDIPMPDSWKRAYTHLLESNDASIRDKADRIAIVLGDRRLLPRMRSVLADATQSHEKRLQALRVLVRSQDKQAVAAFMAALDEPRLRGEAVRALAQYDDSRIATQLIARYRQFGPDVRRDVISTLSSRPSYALHLLDEVEKQTLPRKDVHAYHVRQMRSLRNSLITQRIEEVWGAVRESSADKKARITAYKQQLSSAALAKADLANGRLVFAKTCAACHKLFGEGHEIGPDLTGSNRANLDYILENAIDPSAVVGNDYKMTTLVLNDGRVVTGLIQKETDSALTVRTVNDVTLIAKSSVEERVPSELSLMPDAQLDQLADHEVRDLIAYLASPSQVSLPKVSPTFDAAGRVAGAVEGESIKIVVKSDGDARSQAMAGFTADRWSGEGQLWWTGQTVGSKLVMEVDVTAPGNYGVEVVLTRAVDYGVVQLTLNGMPLGSPIDCFVAGRVDTTGVLRFEPVHLDRGAHRFGATVTGKNEQAVGTMFGLDYVRLVAIPAE